jgi:hypothetical protein
MTGGEGYLTQKLCAADGNKDIIYLPFSSESAFPVDINKQQIKTHRATCLSVLNVCA